MSQKWLLSDIKKAYFISNKYTKTIILYFILSSEINAYQKQIKAMIDISLYFHCSVFWITFDFSIHLMQLTSKVQAPITFLFVNKNIKCG